MIAGSDVILLTKLTALERELHDPSVRRDVHRLRELLHPSFVEIGRSGYRIDLADVLRDLPTEGGNGSITADGFELLRPAEGVAILLYRSAHRSPSGVDSRHAMRSSTWVCEGGEWRMVYHQGTPAEAFDIV
ncbi:hypothetical protein C8J98_10773 [Luteibacter sp. OK325]|jgi:hypothetical protein|nr:hypothetical protein C8J98_10773 [Luteibacter sp. OK325]